MKRNGEEAALTKEVKEEKWNERHAIETAIGTTDFRCKWDGTTLLSVDITDAATRHQVDAQKVLENQLSKQCAFVHNEHALQNVNKQLRSSIPVSPIQNQGAYVSLLARTQQLTVVYPDQKLWRLHFDASGAGSNLDTQSSKGPRFEQNPCKALFTLHPKRVPQMR